MCLLQKSQMQSQCHLDKDGIKNRVCRNIYPVLFLLFSQKHLTEYDKCAVLIIKKSILIAGGTYHELFYRSKEATIFHY